MQIKTVKSYTLLEITVVVTIIGVLAAMALPRYGAALERGYEADAVNQLRTINAAQMIYHSRTGKYWPQAGGGNNGVANINPNLGLNIIENGFAITCTGGNANFSCTAVRTGGASYTLDLDESPLGAANPCCNGNGCPTLPKC